MIHDDLTIPIFVSGQLRDLPRVIWDGMEGPKPEQPEHFICNGCTMSPDYIRGKRAWPACVIHDYQYNHTALDRSTADAIFRRNLAFCLKADGMPGFLAAILAAAYWLVVVRLGASFYNGGGKP